MEKNYLNNQIEKVLRGENTSFLNPTDTKYVENKLKKNNCSYNVFSLYKESEKLIVYQDNLDITLFKIETKSVLTHREILGSLFSHNLSEEIFGDIIIDNNNCYIIVLNKIKKYLLTNFNKIGNKKVSLIEKKLEEVKDFQTNYQENYIQTQSLRIDAVISKLIPTSRKIAQEYISFQKVIVNYQILKNKNYQIKENDIFSIRGIGKFKISQINLNNKKDKYRLIILKYI